MPFLLPLADLPAWSWVGDSSSLSPRCFCWRELGTRSWIVALFLSFIGVWVSTFLLLASSGLWHLKSQSFWISRLAEWCWLWRSPLSILSGMIMMGAGTKPYHLHFVRQLLLSSQAFYSWLVVKRLANSLGRWEEIWRLGAGGSHALTVLSYFRPDGNNTGDLAVAQAKLHISSVALGESSDILELLLSPTYEGRMF